MYYPTFDPSEITLMLITEQEYVNAISEIPGIPIEQDKPWWLKGREPPFSLQYCPPIVEKDGNICDTPISLASSFYGVRPLIMLASQRYKPGSKVQIGKVMCTAIEEDRLFADDVLCLAKYCDVFFIENLLNTHAFIDKYIKP